MAISSINLNPPSSINLPAVNASSPVAGKSQADATPSTIVTLSAQGQKLSQTQTGQPQPGNTQVSGQTDETAKQNLESVPREANEATGIQFMAGGMKGGRISTYA